MILSGSYLYVGNLQQLLFGAKDDSLVGADGRYLMATKTLYIGKYIFVN